MAIHNVMEKLGKAVFESPFGANRIAKDAPELAELRLATLEAVKAKSHRSGGKNIFPYDLIEVELLGISEEQAVIFGGDFLRKYFSEEIRAGLTRSSYRFPEGLEVTFSTTPRLPQPDEAWFTVKTLLRAPASGSASAGTVAHARLTVVKGNSKFTRLTLDKVRMNIGRTAEVYRAAGPSRRNDLFFAGDDEAGSSVSREHAHITRSAKTGEYRLFNDRSYKGDANCALWIVRGGLSQPVHRGPRGTALVNGDEIHLGSAILRFTL